MIKHIITLSFAVESSDTTVTTHRGLLMADAALLEANKDATAGSVVTLDSISVREPFGSK